MTIARLPPDTLHTKVRHTKGEGDLGRGASSQGSPLCYFAIWGGIYRIHPRPDFSSALSCRDKSMSPYYVSRLILGIKYKIHSVTLRLLLSFSHSLETCISPSPTIRKQKFSMSVIKIRVSPSTTTSRQDRRIAVISQQLATNSANTMLAGSSAYWNAPCLA